MAVATPRTVLVPASTPPAMAGLVRVPRTAGMMIAGRGKNLPLRLCGGSSCSMISPVSGAACKLNNSLTISLFLSLYALDMGKKEKWNR